MAWKEKKYKIVQLKHGIEHPFEILPGEFDMEEDAIKYLKEFNPDRHSQFMIVPILIFTPNN
ncbi:hypothetical protein [Sphingobacterium sp. JUb56]|uniref:hypothetical protein n=1 Tax=Sphingobacterium sp. JUb56 TaxID=2587145 RepID=UPI00160AF41E|nr:hypothetical protein [Sphingobacterium sp. JUb56]MBB2951577.1 ribosomal protein RSM22 (predicted rRNA methylase) [Sphingobacterium sp. JUb56]